MTHREIEQDDVVERYLLRRLPAREEAEFEEHYLGCSQCREKLRQDRSLLALLGKACAAWERAPRRPRPWSLWTPAWGLAAALAAVAVYLSLARPPQPPIVETAALPLPVVELRVFRGATGETPRAPAGEPFALRLDARGLAPGSDYAVEIVTASGGPVWSRAGVKLEGEWAQVRVPAKLPAVPHWVRLSRDGVLAREYGLQVTLSRDR